MSTLASIPRRQIVMFILLLFTCQTKIFAQLSAKFTATSVSGCAPIVVQFTDQSTGNPTQWRWDLGNGTISTLRNPSATYFNPGTYNIKLVVRTASEADSVVKEGFVTVHPNPVVNFNASDSTGCFPLPVQFTDQSTTATGNIATWSWDFGDGTTSSVTNPAHTYTSAGNFSVTLKVSNNFGCVKTYSKSQYIKIADGVKAGFTSSSPATCKAPVTIQFNNTSTGPGSLTYTWDFGDGTKSTELNPVHTYTQSGSYSVSLVAVSPQGCRDTVLKQNLVSLGSLTSGFSLPQAVCVGSPITFANTSQPAPGSVLWNFGDGTTSNDISPTKVFSNSGVYTVKLLNDFGGCMDSVIKTVVVKPRPQVDFSAAQTVSCKAPFTVNFANKTAGINSFKWEFGDGATSTAIHPIHTYTREGNYQVTLIAFNENGCSDTLVKSNLIQIQKPVITVSGLPRTGCAPISIAPTASVESNEPVVSYRWNFGDGTTSNLHAPTHTYNTAGNYTVTLTVTTAGGCTDSLVLTHAVRAGNKPKPNFSVNPTDVCAFQPVQFTDKSTGDVDQWHWTFGDGTNSAAQNPEHEYQEIGTFSVSLVAWNNTCPDTLILKDVVTIRPPIAGFTYAGSCTEKYKKVFKDESSGATTWQWDFGDGATSSAQNPAHTYAAPGTYTVQLFVSNGTCTHFTTKTVQVVDEKADFTSSRQEICRDGEIAFAPKNIKAENIAQWQWDFGDGSAVVNTPSASHVFTKNGTYTVTLTITDVLGCADTKTTRVTVYGPTANFNSNLASACLENNNITFSDQSVSDGTNALVKWVWNYGDGAFDSSGKAPYNHQYATAGEYTVSLTVADAFGCVDMMTKPTAVIIAKPIAGFVSPDTLSCTDKPIRFVNQSAGYDLKYQWSFGDGLSGSDVNPVHQYASTGLFTVGLQVTDRYGCKDSVELLKYINISLPAASFTASDTVGNCPPLLVHFTNTSSRYTSLQWDFGDGNTSDKVNPSHYYTIPGVYYATLTITGPGGCTDVATQRIEVKGPKGTFEYEPKIGCNPLTVTFTANTVNRVSFIWDYSDGTTYATKDSVVKHTYEAAGEYVPKMIMIDANGCIVPIVGKDTIKVVGIDADFVMDQTRICDSGMVRFNNTTVSNDYITSYKWNFGDGSTSAEQHPAHGYHTAGSYNASLLVTTQTGCTDSLTLATPVNVYHSPVVNLLGDTAACAPAKLAFGAEVKRGNVDSLQWSWNFSNGQTSALQNPSEQSYSVAGNFPVSVVVTDANGCQTSASRMVNIHGIPNLDIVTKDALVCRDDSLQLKATGADNYSWRAESTLNCINCAEPVARPIESVVYHVTGFSSFGCSKEDSIRITVRQRFQLTINPGDTICAGGTVPLAAFGADKYTWFPAAGLDNTKISNPKAKPQVTTEYSVIASDNDNCFADTAKVVVMVVPLPKVEAGTDLTLPAGSSVQIKTTHSADVTQWNWTPASTLSCADCPSPTAAPRQTTRYVVLAQNAGGCVATDNVTISVICNNGNVFIPNTFSPNNDGSNDRFYPRGSGISMIRSLRVFNRWGELVFERRNFNANDASAGWDGTYKGQPLTPDVFVYTCEVVCMNNEVLPFTGDITLIK